MSVKPEKKEYRQKAKNDIRNLALIKAKAAHYRAVDRLEKLIKFSGARKILLYLPLDYEVDVCRLRRKLSKECEIFAPFMVGLSLKMVKLRMPFIVHKFNVRQPLGRKMDKIRLDMAVVPVIGVDGTIARIGHGKGFYDRFFNTLPYRPKMIVFVQIKDFFTSQILTEKHDVRGDFYITPRKNYIKRGTYDRSFNRLRSRCGGSWRRISVC